MEHLLLNNLVSSNQFGFSPNHSSCTQLLCALNKMFCAFDANNSADLIYTDIDKAFDSVSHLKLISVLSFYGITGNLLKWIECFFNNRTRLVCVNNQCSFILPVGSGVPQGSILGPLLLLFI